MNQYNGYPGASPGQAPAAMPGMPMTPKPEKGPNPKGGIAAGLANLTEEEAVTLDGMLESNPHITALLIKAFPRQAADIQYFLKSVTSGMEQGGMQDPGGGAMPPAAPMPQMSQMSQTPQMPQMPMGGANPLSSIVAR